MCLIIWCFSSTSHSMFEVEYYSPSQKCMLKTISLYVMPLYCMGDTDVLLDSSSVGWHFDLMLVIPAHSTLTKTCKCPWEIQWSIWQEIRVHLCLQRICNQWTTTWRIDTRKQRKSMLHAFSKSCIKSNNIIHLFFPGAGAKSGL